MTGWVITCVHVISANTNDLLPAHEHGSISVVTVCSCGFCFFDGKLKVLIHEKSFSVNSFPPVLCFLRFVCPTVFSGPLDDLITCFLGCFALGVDYVFGKVIVGMMTDKMFVHFTLGIGGI